MAAHILRVFVVDDSSLFRKVITDSVEKMAFARLSGYARDGKEALEKIGMLQPDVVTLDVEMPVMDGIETLKVINEKWPNIKVIMVTSLNQYSVNHTIEALEGSAFGFITKPDIGGAEHIAVELHRIVQGIAQETFGVSEESAFVQPVRKVRHIAPIREPRKPLITAIGISTGGPNALVKIIPQLPASLSIPILIVQHMPEGFTAPLAASLNSKAAVQVKEAQHGEKLRPGVVYIAPGGKQMKVMASDIGIGQIVITNDPPEQYCKPSVDYLYRSLAEEFPGRILPVIMTGMGSDGTNGLKLLKQSGAYAIGQDKATSTVYGMPGAAKREGVIDIEVPLEEIVPTILKNL